MSRKQIITGPDRFFKPSNHDAKVANNLFVLADAHSIPILSCDSNTWTTKTEPAAYLAQISKIPTIPDCKHLNVVFVILSSHDKDLEIEFFKDVRKSIKHSEIVAWSKEVFESPFVVCCPEIFTQQFTAPALIQAMQKSNLPFTPRSTILISRNPLLQQHAVRLKLPCLEPAAPGSLKLKNQDKYKQAWERCEFISEEIDIDGTSFVEAGILHDLDSKSDSVINKHLPCFSPPKLEKPPKVQRKFLTQRLPPVQRIYEIVEFLHQVFNSQIEIIEFHFSFLEDAPEESLLKALIADLSKMATIRDTALTNLLKADDGRYFQQHIQLLIELTQSSIKHYEALFTNFKSYEPTWNHLLAELQIRLRWLNFLQKTRDCLLKSQFKTAGSLIDTPPSTYCRIMRLEKDAVLIEACAKINRICQGILDGTLSREVVVFFENSPAEIAQAEEALRKMAHDEDDPRFPHLAAVKKLGTQIIVLQIAEKYELEQEQLTAIATDVAKWYETQPVFIANNDDDFYLEEFRLIEDYFSCK